MVLLPTFPILRAGESHYREKTKFPKLAETSSFLRIRSYPASFLSETPNYKRNGSSVGVRSFVKLASRSDPIAGATAARGIRAAPPIHRTVTVARGMVIPERRPDGLWLQSLKVTQRSFDLRRPLRMRFAPSGDGQIPINSP